VAKLTAGKGKCALDIGCAYGYGVEVIIALRYVAFECNISPYTVNKANEIHGWMRCLCLDMCKETLPKNMT